MHPSAPSQHNQINNVIIRMMQRVSHTKPLIGVSLLIRITLDSLIKALQKAQTIAGRVHMKQDNALLTERLFRTIIYI